MRRFLSRRAPGQSIIVIALMLIVLIGFIGLSVDVGNVYGQQRRVQTGVNAGALAGMLAMKQPKTNIGVRQDIEKALQGHGFDLSSGEYQWQAYYSFEKAAGQTQNPIEIIPSNGSTAPSKAILVTVEMTKRVDTYFARVVGRPSLPANAIGYACSGGYGTGVYPIAVPFVLKRDVHTQYVNWNRTTRTGTPLAIADWDTAEKNWSLTNNIFKLPVTNNTGGVSGQHIGWMTFATGSSGGGSASDLAAQLYNPGMYHPGPEGQSCSSGDLGCYQEQWPVPSPLPPGGVAPARTDLQHNNQITVFDWIQGNTGISGANDINDALEQHVELNDTMILPMYGAAYGSGNNGRFQILGIGGFKLLDYEFNGGNKYLIFEYVGEAPTGAVSCIPNSGGSTQ